MIRHGRSVVDREGVAQLHGLSWHTARRRKPWAEPGHPRPVNQPSGELRPSRPPALWDTEQVRAYAAGLPVPDLEDADHPNDLLDDREVAALHGLTIEQFHRIHTDNRVKLTIPDPDEEPCGVAHWRRATAEMMQLRALPAEADEHRPQYRYRSLAERRAALAAVASAMAEAGEPMNISVLARRAGVSRSGARAFLRERPS